MKLIRNTGIVLVALLVHAIAFAQPLIRPIQYDMNATDFRRLSFSKDVYHSVSRSFVESQFTNEVDSFRWERKRHKNWFIRKLRNENLVVIDTGDLYLTLDFLFNFQYGQDLADTANQNLTTNTRGIRIQGAIGEKLAFYSTFWENQSYFPEYLSDHIDETGVVPGQGRFKSFGETGYDYAMASGVVSYTPWKRWNIQFGHGKNFIGDGYRSLFLSDNTFNYPHLKSTLSLFNNKIQYQVIYASLQQLERIPATTSSEAQFIRKAGTFHTLSYSPNRIFEVSLFEGLVYQNWDSTGTVSLPWNFYMPVIFLNTGVEGMESNSAKPVLGINMRVDPFKGYKIYGQFAYDYNTTSNTAFQAGFAAYDAFDVNDLTLQFEWNNISQNMYGHQNPRNAYTHYGGYLAHPTGADLNEFIGIVQYRYHDFFVNVKLVFSDRRSPVEVDLGQGSTATVLRNENVNYTDLSCGYLLNEKSNMKIKLGYTGRNLSYGLTTEKTGWYYISFLTDLKNAYYDF